MTEQELRVLLAGPVSVVSRPKGSGQYKAMAAYIERWIGRSAADSLLSAFRAYDLDAAKRFVARGKGISIMPRIMVNNEVEAAQLWAVKLPENPERTWYCVWSKTRHRFSRLHDFIDTLSKGVQRNLEGGNTAALG